MRDYEDMNKNGWIKVEDRLPIPYEKGEWDGDRSGFVLVIDIDGLYHLAGLYSGFMDGFSFDEFFDTNDREVSNVIAWQPLPKAEL
jgi:hypothetical protein